MQATDFIIPIIVGAIILYALIKKVDVWGEFLSGAKENLKVTADILPALVGIMVAIGMFRQSGAIDYLTGALAPLLNWAGFPADCVPLALIRPISGSGATAAFENILSSNHPDSFTGRVASVMLGSSETTFYTAAVYFAATKIKKTRHAVPCALFGDLIGPLICTLVVRFMFP